jgi:arginine/lysine/ornithine decarboxylase
VGNHAAILATVAPSDAVLVPRASHRSVHAALALSGATPVWVPNRFDDELGGWFVPDPAEARRLAAANGSVKLVHLTRPVYYGIASDLAEWRQLADELDAVLVVDEAHGSHLVLHGPNWPSPALEHGADLVIQSTHKTFGALTQASMLHLGRTHSGGATGRVDTYRLSQVLALLQSSSPSYLLLASLDAARARVDEEGPLLRDRLVEVVARARRGLASIEQLRLWPLRSDLDPTKIVIDVGLDARSGYDVAATLRAHGTPPELADDERVVFSLTIADSNRSVDALAEAVSSALTLVSASPTRPSRLEPPPTPRAAATLGEALRARAEFVPFAQATSQVSAEFVIPYPPGIPALIPGEVIDEATSDFLSRVLTSGGRIVGPVDPTLGSIGVIPRC